MPKKCADAQLTDPAVLAKYDAHWKACARLGIAPESLETFARDVAQTPQRARASVLTIDRPGQYEPVRQYDVYISPKDL